MTVKAIIFDFDGTLADTHDALLEITNRLAAEFGYKPVSETELELLKSLSSKEIVKRSQIAPIVIPFLLKRIKTELGKEIRNLKTIAGIETALLQLKKQGYQLGIVTSNHKDNVLVFLKNNNLESLFDFIYSGASLFGKHKILARILKQYNLKPDEVIYVGDETRDILAAKKSQIKAMAVGWGFNSPSVLAQHHPDFLIYHPQEMTEIANSCDRTFQTVPYQTVQ
jgi:phosphoglycolate phosphatase